MNSFTKPTQHHDNNSSNKKLAVLGLKLSLIFCLIVIAFIIGTSASAQYTDIKRLGTSQAICAKPGVQTAAELQAFFANNSETVNQILNAAAWQGDKPALFTAVQNGEFTEQMYPIGTTFEWMGMRDKKQVVSSSKRRWAGEESFPGFEINIENACVNYQLVVPKICCNVALATATKIVSEPSLTVNIDGNSMTICADNSKVVLTRPDNTSEGLILDNSGCWLGNQLSTGEYTVKASDECGTTVKTVSIGPKAAPLNEDKSPDGEKLIPFIAAFAGTETLMRLETAWDMEKRDSSGIAGLRAGLKVPLTQSLKFVPSIGVLHRDGVNNGNVYPEDTIFADAGLEANITKNFFVGGGLGVWDINDSDFREPSIFINAGGSITPATQWFVEARGIDSDNPDGKDGFSDNHTFNAGIRLLFR